MDYLEKKAYIFGSFFSLSNKLQAIGDKFDKNLTIKQWLLVVSIFKSRVIHLRSVKLQHS